MKGKPPGLYKADGTPVKNPANYIAAMKKTGGYQGGLFDETGEEVADPQEYLSRM